MCRGFKSLLRYQSSPLRHGGVLATTDQRIQLSLDFITGLKTSRQGQSAYETIIGYRNEKPGALPKPITEVPQARLQIPHPASQ